jgi:hypothetical protein
MIYFGSLVQKFQSIAIGSVNSSPMVRQNIMMAGTCREGGCSSYDRQEAVNEEGTGDLHDLLSLTRLHLLKFPKTPNSTNS